MTINSSHMTKEEIQKELDELGIEYDAEAKKPELELKLAEAKDKAEEESAEVEEPQEEKESVGSNIKLFLNSVSS